MKRALVIGMAIGAGVLLLIAGGAGVLFVGARAFASFSNLRAHPAMTRGGPDEEPGMVGLPVRAGDAVLFTENLRHGGLTNRSEQPRKTLHVGYGPVWMLFVFSGPRRGSLSPDGWMRAARGICRNSLGVGE